MKLKTTFFNMKHLFKSLLSVCTFLVAVACNGQGSRDNPVINNQSNAFASKISTFLGKEKVSLFQNANVVQAYHLKIFEKDTSATGFMGYKVVKSIARLANEDVDSLKKILRDTTLYTFKISGKRCEFAPDLAFRFVKGDSSSVIFISLDCDMINFRYTGKLEIMTDCDKAHNKYVAFAKRIFPAHYRNVSLRPTQTVIQPIVSVDSTNVVDSTSRRSVEKQVKENIIKHKVAKGENIKKIAEKYKVSEKDILSWNGMEKPLPLEAGMELIIKVPNMPEKKLPEKVNEKQNPAEKKDRKTKNKPE